MQHVPNWTSRRPVVNKLPSLIPNLVIPVQRLMLDLRPRRRELPSKSILDILHHVTSKFDIPHIRGMPLRTDIIMLKDTGGVEVIDKRFCLSCC